VPQQSWQAIEGFAGPATEQATSHFHYDGNCGGSPIEKTSGCDQYGNRDDRRSQTWSGSFPINAPLAPL